MSWVAALERAEEIRLSSQIIHVATILNTPLISKSAGLHLDC